MMAQNNRNIYLAVAETLEDELYHYNHRHNPKNGQFAEANSGVLDSTGKNQKKTNKSTVATKSTKPRRTLEEIDDAMYDYRERFNSFNPTVRAIRDEALNADKKTVEKYNLAQYKDVLNSKSPFKILARHKAKEEQKKEFRELVDNLNKHVAKYGEDYVDRLLEEDEGWKKLKKEKNRAIAEREYKQAKDNDIYQLDFLEETQNDELDSKSKLREYKKYLNDYDSWKANRRAKTQKTINQNKYNSAAKEGKYDLDFLEAIQNDDYDDEKTLSEYKKYLEDPQKYMMSHSETNMADVRVDELYHYNKNHDPKTGRFTFSRGGGVTVLKSASGLRQRLAERKARKDAEKREKVLKTGSSEEILKYAKKHHLSKQELDEAYNRIDSQKRLSELDTAVKAEEANKKAAQVSLAFKNGAETLSNIKNFAERGVDFYNLAARVNNSIRPDKPMKLIGQGQVEIIKDPVTRAIARETINELSKKSTEEIQKDIESGKSSKVKSFFDNYSAVEKMAGPSVRPKPNDEKSAKPKSDQNSAESSVSKVVSESNKTKVSDAVKSETKNTGEKVVTNINRDISITDLWDSYYGNQSSADNSSTSQDTTKKGGLFSRFRKR